MRTHADYLMDCALAAAIKASSARAAGDMERADVCERQAARYKAEAAQAQGRPATN